MLIEQLLLLGLIVGLFYMLGVGFAWLAWHVYRLWHLVGLLMLWVSSAAALALLLKLWIYSHPLNLPGADPTPFVFGFLLLLTTFGAAAAYIVRKQRTGSTLSFEVAFFAGVVHLVVAFVFPLIAMTHDIASQLLQ